MKIGLKIVVLVCSLLVFSCSKEKKKIEVNNKPVLNRHEPKEVAFTFQKSENWLKNEGTNTKALDIVLAINRVDFVHLKKLDSILVPTDISGDLEYYMHFPLEVATLNEVTKVIIFSYATQAFATYEYGVLTHVGPTSMGREKDKTPTGLFFTNWKAEETISTFNDEWKLKWNFNIDNKLGVGFHEYELPGYPASHSCLRLLEKDAKMLYEFADQWELENAEKVKLKGTPVVVFGSYEFKNPKIWNTLPQNAKSLSISEAALATIISSYLQSILKEQAKRETI